MSHDAPSSAAAQPIGEHIEITPRVLYIGTPVVLITTLNADGTTNISPISSVWTLADRAVIGMSSTSQGRENALRERQMVLNFPSPDLWPKVEAIARATGRKQVPAHKQQIGYAFDPDKFAASGLRPQASSVVRAPRIAQCPIQFEAEVLAWHDPAGDWPRQRPEAFQIIEAKILKVHAHRDIVAPGDGHIDTARWSPLLYVFRHYFGTGSDLGWTFKSQI